MVVTTVTVNIAITVTTVVMTPFVTAQRLTRWKRLKTDGALMSLSTMTNQTVTNISVISNGTVTTVIMTVVVIIIIITNRFPVTGFVST